MRETKKMSGYQPPRKGSKQQVPSQISRDTRKQPYKNKK